MTSDMTPDLEAKLRTIFRDATPKQQAELDALIADERVQEIKREHDIEPSHDSTFMERVVHATS